jgi:small subunit ribosomal protein S5
MLLELQDLYSNFSNMTQDALTPETVAPVAVETQNEAPGRGERPTDGRAPRRDGGGRPGGGRNGDRRGGFKDAPKEFQEELLEIARVTRVTAGGRQLRFRASVVIGNGKGTIGYGTGKAGEVSVAVEKAVRDAKKNLMTFPIENGTIPHGVTENFKATTVMIHPASEGTGIIAGGAIRKLAFVSGLKDIIIKRYGGTNPLTNIRAIFRAFAALKPSSAGFAGRKIAVISEDTAPAVSVAKPKTSAKKTTKA